MKKITAKFNSKCAETGKPIKKGDVMYYDYAAKKCYTMDSKKAKDWEADQETRDIQSFIQAQEDAYWDNVTGGYYTS